MKCYYHNESDAVAICKNCGKAVCSECASDVGNGIACKDKCEAEVKALVDLIERNKTAYQKTSGAYSNMALFLVISGALILLFGLLSFSRSAGLSSFLMLMGVSLFIGAFLCYSSGRKFLQK